MSHYRVNKASLHGEITTPPSKSHTLRAILFGSLAKGKSRIHNYLASTDTQSMVDACRLLGATIELTPTSIEIQGVNGSIKHAQDVIHAGNSGIVLRFCSAIGALASLPIVVTGDHSIRTQRPMHTLLDALSQLNVSAKSMRGDGYAPVILQGPLRPGMAVLSGEDSQPVSALLIAAAFAEGPIELHVHNPGEKPWINLTLEWLDRLGIPYIDKDHMYYRLEGNACYDGFEYTVPGDFSSAAFPVAAALVSGSELKVHNVDMRDSQGDKALIHLFQNMGANIEIDDELRCLHIKKGKKLIGMPVDINDFVDAITILAVVACYAEGETHIYNGAVARQKECNRIRSIATELSKMGAYIQETEDGLRIRSSSLKGSKLHSYNDHRMAMSLTVAALGAEGETNISPVGCISKTFPSFYDDFNRLGANIKELP